ncbi:MAG: hypothetical protein SPI49_03340 [Eubacteriales bacterium]|nr:hypothetical protein [Eubacteriales bacterium]
MLKKTITYNDYDGNERTEDFYFNLTKAEVMEMELGINGGLTKFLQKIVSERDNSKIIEMFKNIILKSYGEKSLDGKRFIKNEEIANNFSQTEAYVELFMELATDAESAAAFINGIVPKYKDNNDKLKEENKVKNIENNQ